MSEHVGVWLLTLDKMTTILDNYHPRWTPQEQAMTVALVTKFAALAFVAAGIAWFVSQALESLATVASVLAV